MTGHTSWGKATAKRRQGMTATELEAHDAAVATEKAAALAEIEAFEAEAGTSLRVEVRARASGHVPGDELLARLRRILGEGAQVTISRPSTESVAMFVIAVMIGITAYNRSKEGPLARGREVADKVRVEVEQVGGEFVAETIQVPAA